MRPGGRLLHRAHARSREQRERDDGNFPQVDRAAAGARGCADRCCPSRCGSRSTARRRRRRAAATAIRARAPPPGSAARARKARARSSRSSSQTPTGSAGSCWNSIGMRCTPRAASVVGEGAAHHHVARLVDLAEQAGIAFHRAVGIDGGARREHGRHGGFGVGCEHDVSLSASPVRGARDAASSDARCEPRGAYRIGTRDQPPTRATRFARLATRVPARGDA